MDLGTVGIFVAGLLLLVAGAETLVRGASRLALAMGISPLVVGLTVVAYGTSAPEMAVSVKSAFQGDAGANLAFGNVVGSNIFNILVVLGASATIAPLVVHQQLIRLDVPILIAISILVLLFGLDGGIGRLEGAVLFGGGIAYTGFLVWQSRRESKAIDEQYAAELGSERPHGSSGWVVDLVWIAVGLGLLVLGARWLVDASITFARVFGVSELVIGLTIVAAGTSMPEVATSIIAAVRGERDIAIGNVIGSSLFNLLAVLGLASCVAPDGIAVAPAALNLDLPVMIAVTIACLPIFFRAHCIARWEGLLFLTFYAAYAAYLILASQRHDALPAYSWVMLEFVLPLTALTIGVLCFRGWRDRRRNGAAAP